MNKLIKITHDHYIGVDDSEKQEGDFCFYKNRVFQIERGDNELYHLSKKITYSTQPIELVDWENGVKGKRPAFDKIKSLSLSEVEELLYGYNVEKMAENRFPITKGSSMWMPSSHDCSQANKQEGFIEGFKAHQELTKDKLFTKRDMIAAFIEGTNSGAQYADLAENDFEEIEEFSKNEMNNFIQSLHPKTEWNVRFNKQGKLELL